MIARVTLAEGLTRDFVVAEEQSFSGDEITLSGKLPLDDIAGLVTKSQESLGDTSSFEGTTVELSPPSPFEGNWAISGSTRTTSPPCPSPSPRAP